MKTTHPFPTTTTTIDPYERYDDAFIYSDVSHTKNIDYITDNFRDMENVYAYTVKALKQVYDIAAYINFFINIPHLFILTRKELRSNLVYIIMTGICLCDILHSIGKMTQIFMTWQIVYKDQECYGVYPYYHVLIDVIAKCIQIMARRCSGFLALFIAMFRAFSVVFPMSNAVNFLMKAKSGYLIVLFFAVICAGWSSLYYFCTVITKVITCPQGYTPSWVMYEQDTFGKKEIQLRMIDGCIAIVVCILYLLVAIALVIALAQAKKRRKNLKSDKATNTSMLVMMMAVFMFISEMVYGLIFLAIFFKLSDFQEKGYFSQLEVFAMTLSIINSIAHCFICFWMSSQYRDVVKSLINWKEKEKEENVKVAVVESSAHPTTVQTTKNSNGSKKTF